MARVDFDLVWSREELPMKTCVEFGRILACAARQVRPANRPTKGRRIMDLSLRQRCREIHTHHTVPPRGPLFGGSRKAIEPADDVHVLEAG